MARRVYFAFHYQNDIWRVNQVRNSWVTQDREAAGFYDASLWEKVKKEGSTAITRMINDGLKNTSVTVVLIGKQTSNRIWVKYEIQKSYQDGKGMFGIFIHNLKDQGGNLSDKGDALFGEIGKDAAGNSVYFNKYPTYDWVIDDGYKNFGDWAEKAAKAAGKSLSMW